MVCHFFAFLCILLNVLSCFVILKLPAIFTSPWSDGPLGIAEADEMEAEEKAVEEETGPQEYTAVSHWECTLRNAEPSTGP